MTRPSSTLSLAVALAIPFALVVALGAGCPPPLGEEGEGEGDVAGEGEGEAGEGEGEGEGDRPDPDPDNPDNAIIDTDCDGLSDAEEFGTVYPGGDATDPGNADTDGDGIDDGTEVGRTTSVDPSCDGLFTPDADPDTVTDPTGSDTDGDGVGDGDEDADHDGELDRNVETDPNNPDSDGDQLCDGDVDVPPICTGGDDQPVPIAPDGDGDGLPDAVDPAPADPDADDDGLCDGPDDVAGVCVAGEDTDGDGFVDPGESDPLQPDSDCDGIDDPGEREGGTNPSNADSDGDGVVDGIETGAPARGALGDCPAFVGDGDAPGGTTTDPNNPDSDGDGVPDGAEDPNQNGVVDPGELNPNDPADGNDPTVQAACALDNLVPVVSRIVIEADIQVALPRRDGNAFADVVTIRDAGGAPIGVAGHDREHQVAFVAVKRTPAGADPLADETAVRALLNGAGAVDNGTALTRVFQFPPGTWDGYPGLEASYDMAAAGAGAGAKAQANAIIAAFGGTGALDVADDPAAAAGAFKVELEIVQRSASTSIVLVALTPAELFDGASGFLTRDLADGSALAQAADTTGVQCDRVPSEGFAQLDILWAVDNSASMEQKQAAVASAADSMAQRLANAGVTFRTAVVTSGFYAPPANAGCTNAACADNTGSQCRELTADLARFAGWLTRDVDGDGASDPTWIGAGNDNGFSCNVAREAIVRGAQLILSDPGVGGAVTFMPPAPSPSNVQMQAGGHLLIMFVGDVDDQFPNPAPADVNPVIDGYEAFFRALPLASVQMGGILCPIGQTCGENNFRNPRVDHAVINRFGGVIGSIQDLAAIPGNVNAILDGALVNVSPYVLSAAPITSTVKVAMDAGTTLGACNTADVPRSRVDGFDVDPITRTVAFFGNCRPDPAQAGSLIAISYRTWIDQSPLADPPVPACDVCASCTGIERCDLEQCACVCDAELSCRDGFVWDNGVCGCVCDGAGLQCDATHAPDENLCACVCQPSCGDACGPTEICSGTCNCVDISGG